MASKVSTNQPLPTSVSISPTLSSHFSLSWSLSHTKHFPDLGAFYLLSFCLDTHLPL